LEVRRILVLSHTTGYQLRAFNDAADTLGIELVFATDRCHQLDDPWQDRAIPVRFHEPDASVDAIVKSQRVRPVDGVVAVGDRPVVLAARAADALKLPWHSVAGALASTDKRRSRAVLARAGLPSPEFTVLSIASAPDRDLSDRQPPASDLQPPVVLKPLGLSGSRGVIRADDQREFVAAFERIRALLNRPQVRAARSRLEDAILVERYIDGREFAIEGVVTHGLLRVFAIFDKPDPLQGPFFEETIYTTPSALDGDLQARIIDHVARGAHALGLCHGPVHAECRVTADGDVYVLEIAGRPIGGLCSRVLRLERMHAPTSDPRPATSASLEEVLLRHALGEPAEHWMREAQGAAVMMIPIPARGMLKAVTGEDAARLVPGVTDVRITAKIGQLLEPLPEAGSYLGFIFARGQNAREAETAVREAHGFLTFEISRELPVTSNQ
jgi:biotin carboxylase